MSNPTAHAPMQHTARPQWRREAWHSRWHALTARLRMAGGALVATPVIGLVLAPPFRQGIAGWLWPESRGVELRQQAERVLPLY